MDDATRKQIDLLTQVTDVEVRARKNLTDVLEFLHAEVQTRIEIIVRTRGLRPPYTIDGCEHQDPRFVTTLVRLEVMQIVDVTTFVTSSIDRGPEHLRVALLYCNQLLSLYIDKLEGWGGLAVRSTFLGKPDRTKEWLEVRRDQACATTVELAKQIADAQKHDTLRPTDDTKPEGT